MKRERSLEPRGWGAAWGAIAVSTLTTIEKNDHSEKEPGRIACFRQHESSRWGECQVNQMSSESMLVIDEK